MPERKVGTSAPMSAGAPSGTPRESGWADPGPAASVTVMVAAFRRDHPERVDGTDTRPWLSVP